MLNGIFAEIDSDITIGSKADYPLSMAWRQGSLKTHFVSPESLNICLLKIMAELLIGDLESNATQLCSSATRLSARFGYLL